MNISACIFFYMEWIYSGVPLFMNDFGLLVISNPDRAKVNKRMNR